MKIILLALVCGGMAIFTSYVASELVKEFSKAQTARYEKRK